MSVSVSPLGRKSSKSFNQTKPHQGRQQRPLTEIKPRKSLGQVCAEAAEPLAALLDHPDMPADVSLSIVQAICELNDNIFQRTETDGEYIRRALTEMAGKAS